MDNRLEALFREHGVKRPFAWWAVVFVSLLLWGRTEILAAKIAALEIERARDSVVIKAAEDYVFKAKDH